VETFRVSFTGSSAAMDEAHTRNESWQRLRAPRSQAERHCIAIGDPTATEELPLELEYRGLLTEAHAP
jgi:hypothetical protein